MLKRETIPNHVAIIMDGNGRWAKARHRPRIFGHSQGMKSVRTVVEAADHLGVKVLSLYAFSEENWARPEQEVGFIMSLVDTYLMKERDELHAKNVQLRVMGNIDRLPAQTLELVRESIDMMSGNTGLVLNVALSYGGRAELVEACRQIASSVEKGQIAAADVDRDMLEAQLLTNGLPDPDLLIRTSGEQRLSNFMLWQMAYTEFYFTDVFWPDFGRKDFETALEDYARRNRRFGLIESAKTIVPRLIKTSGKELHA